MQQRCLIRNNSKKCILFFNGWGMDESAINHLDAEGYDLFHFSSYSNFSALDSSDFTYYEEIILVAWSLGVVAAELVLSKSNIKISKAIAINGTSYGMHDEYGISESVFKGTLDNWNERNRNKFNMRMFACSKSLSSEFLSDRAVESQKAELAFLFAQIKARDEYNLIWDFAIIGSLDLIIPSKSQIAFWSGKIDFCEDDLPHFPFNKYNSWSQIIDKFPKYE